MVVGLIQLSHRNDFVVIYQQSWQQRNAPRQKDARVDTAYKKVKDKVKPVNSNRLDGSTPGGINDWKQQAIARKALLDCDPNQPYAAWLIPKFSTIACGFCLTPKRLKTMIVGLAMTTEEKDVLVEMFHNQEKAIAFLFKEMGMIKSDVAPPQKIRTIPHKAWQSQRFAILKALISTVTEMLRECLN